MKTATSLIADWRHRATCRNRGTNLWFPASPNNVAQIKEAKAVCATCPVTAQCLQAGIGEAGIWGGLTEDERAALLGRRRRGRPAGESRVNHGLGIGHPRKGGAP